MIKNILEHERLMDQWDVYYGHPPMFKICLMSLASLSIFCAFLLCIGS